MLRHRLTRRISLTAAILLAAAASTVGVSASTIGSVSSQALDAFTYTVSTGAPQVLAYENFTGAAGTNLVGTTTDGGGLTWAANPTGGSWKVSANNAISTTANSSLVVNPGVFNYSVAATVNRGSVTGFDAGLTCNRNAAGTEFLTAEWTSNSSGSLELWKFSGGGWTSLGAAINLYPGGIATAPASIDLVLTCSATQLIGKINGVTIITYAFVPADISLFKNATHQLGGPYQWTSNNLTFDNFHVDNP